MSDIFCIIVVGYNRPASMERLLDSLLKAEYFGDQVDLLISLDKGSKQPELIESLSLCPTDGSEEEV